MLWNWVVVWFKCENASRSSHMGTCGPHWWHCLERLWSLGEEESGLVGFEVLLLFHCLLPDCRCNVTSSYPLLPCILLHDKLHPYSVSQYGSFISRVLLVSQFVLATRNRTNAGGRSHWHVLGTVWEAQGPRSRCQQTELLLCAPPWIINGCRLAISLCSRRRKSQCLRKTPILSWTLL